MRCTASLWQAVLLRGLAFCSLALVQKVSDLMPISARLCNFGRHVRKTETQCLEFADRMSELLAFLKVVPHIFDRPARNLLLCARAIFRPAEFGRKTTSSQGSCRSDRMSYPWISFLALTVS